MLKTAAVFALPAGGAAGAFFPLPAYMAPNALFPIMALFFWLRPDEYRPYILLYTAGKIVGIAANLGWLAFSLKNGALSRAVYGDFSARVFLGSALALALLDGFSALGGFLLNRDRVKAARIGGDPQ